jgi:hypothetical protein
LLGLALPQTNGKSLTISKRRIIALFIILGADVSGLFLLVFFGEHFWMGWHVFLSSLAAIALLILAAKYASSSIVYVRTNVPRISPLRIGIIAALFYTSVLFCEQLGIDRVPALVDMGFVLFIQGLFLFYIQRVIGRENNARHLIALTAGLVAPIATIGFIAQLYLPIVLVADLAFGLLIWKLMRNYSDSSKISGPSNL